jgi:hypothetical protein
MSGVGQTETSTPRCQMSVLPSGADIVRLNAQVCSVPISHLADQGLLEEGFDLRKLLKTVSQYARRYFSPTIEGSVTVNPTGFPTFSGKITPAEPPRNQSADGYISLDDLAAYAEKALSAAKFQIWILLDRLDVAFAETHDLEKNAIRALFRVYRDFGSHDHIRLKIFLRTDIWSRIVDDGFREASHITKEITLEWSNNALLNLIIRRVLSNQMLVKEEHIDRATVLSNFPAQSDLFYKLFPQQVDQGAKKPSTLDWIISRCADGTDKTAPREVIHLLNSLREQEIARLERGESSPPGSQLFDRAVFKSALPAVSETKLITNLFAEYPELKPAMQRLKGEKTEQTRETFASLIGASEQGAIECAEQLVSIGFFQKRGSREHPTFWVPFLYRDALHMIQGLADE